MITRKIGLQRPSDMHVYHGYIPPPKSKSSQNPPDIRNIVITLSLIKCTVYDLAVSGVLYLLYFFIHARPQSLLDETRRANVMAGRGRSSTGAISENHCSRYRRPNCDSGEGRLDEGCSSERGGVGDRSGLRRQAMRAAVWHGCRW
jgi:hypothetical protein